MDIEVMLWWWYWPVMPVLLVCHDVVAVLCGRQRALVLEPLEWRLGGVQREVALVGQRPVARVSVRRTIRLATNILVRWPIHTLAAAPPPQHARWRSSWPLQHRPEMITHVEPGFVTWARSPAIHIRRTYTWRIFKRPHRSRITNFTIALLILQVKTTETWTLTASTRPGDDRWQIALTTATQRASPPAKIERKLRSFYK